MRLRGARAARVAARAAAGGASSQQLKEPGRPSEELRPPPPAVVCLPRMDGGAAARLESYAADRAALLQYVLESPMVVDRVLWPSADRNAVDAVQILGHPIDLDKVDVQDVYLLLCKGLLFSCQVSCSLMIKRDFLWSEQAALHPGGGLHHRPERCGGAGWPSREAQEVAATPVCSA